MMCQWAIVLVIWFEDKFVCLSKAIFAKASGGTEESSASSWNGQRSVIWHPRCHRNIFWGAQVMVMILRITRCCLWCLERFIKFVNKTPRQQYSNTSSWTSYAHLLAHDDSCSIRNAYIQIAINGHNFCTAAKKASWSNIAMFFRWIHLKDESQKLRQIWCCSFLRRSSWFWTMHCALGLLHCWDLLLILLGLLADDFIAKRLFREYRGGVLHASWCNSSKYTEVPLHHSCYGQGLRHSADGQMKQTISNDEVLNLLNVIQVGLGYLYLLGMHPDALPVVPIVSQ